MQQRGWILKALCWVKKIRQGNSLRSYMWNLKPNNGQSYRKRDWI